MEKHKHMVEIETNLIKDVVYNLCKQAAIEFSEYPYKKISDEYKKTKSKKLAHIIQNAENADKIKRPLCQDTGCVHVFLEIGNKVSFSSDPFKAINEGIRQCYTENYFRKSIVENILVSGKNREDNTPAVISVDYTEGSTLKIKILLKGAGCDNVSEIKMLLPSITEEELIKYAGDVILEKGKNACPPLFVSVAIGGCAENVMQEAEKAYFHKKNELPEISERIKQYLMKKSDKKNQTIITADILTTIKPHHMASLPIAIAFNCHSLRIAEAEIIDNKAVYITKIKKIEHITSETEKLKEINTEDIKAVRALKEGENVLLTGKILIARDAAHKKMLEYKHRGEKLPFDTENKMIFYAAPCPSKPGEIIGPIGPTTANRMDKYIEEFPQILATIGKGSRSKSAEDIIRKNQSVYFEIEGGISTLLAASFKSCQKIAFEELSTEAVYQAEINKLHAKVSISSNK